MVLRELRSNWHLLRFASHIRTQYFIQFLAACFARWGPPDELMRASDRHLFWTEFEEFLRRSTSKSKTALSHPQSNRCFEGFNSGERRLQDRRADRTRIRRAATLRDAEHITAAEHHLEIPIRRSSRRCSQVLDKWATIIYTICWLFSLFIFIQCTVIHKR